MAEVSLSPFVAPTAIVRAAADKLRVVRLSVAELGLDALAIELLRIEKRLIGTTFTLNTTGPRPVFTADVPD